MRRARLLPAFLVLGACTLGPNYSRPATAVPRAYLEPHSAAPLSDSELGTWWNSFGDRKLDELVNRAIAQNLDVETAAAKIREARAEEKAAGAALLPTVSTNASVTRQRISENAIPIPPGSGGAVGGGGSFGLPGSEFTTWRAGFDASWEIDLFGKTRRSIEAATARTGAAIWTRRDIQVSAAAEVASAYLELRTLQQRILLATAEVERQQRLERLIRARLRGGLVTGEDLEQQSSGLANARAAIPPLRASQDIEIHKIGVLTGDSPEALVAELGPAGPLPLLTPDVPAGLPSDLLRRRPDIRAAERSLAASTADIGVATAELYPSFSLSAAPALVSTALASLLTWGSRSFTAGASLDWPIFNGGRTRANIEVKNAKAQQALVAYKKTVLGALQDVEDALARIDNDRKAIADLEAALASARRAEDIARERYTGGLVTYSDVLGEQARRISLENRVVEMRGSQALDTIALYKALGGGWPEMAERGAQQ
jgi:outer membrane protein, multidrug efflux system